MYYSIDPFGEEIWEDLKVNWNDFPLGKCPCGNVPNYLNIGRIQMCYCQECKTKWNLGENVFSSWRYENKEIWEENENFLMNYNQIF